MNKFLWITTMMALVSGIAGETQAASIVSTDSGNIGNFKFENTGISGNTATINMTVARGPGIQPSTVDTVNGSVIAQQVTQLSTPFMFTVTPTGNGNYAVVLPNNVTQTIGETPGQQAILGINITQGNAPINLPNFFNVSGPITSLIANKNPSYDYGLFGLPGATINTTLTATTFTGTSSFAGLFSTVGATAVGNGSFSQAAVPEPASAALFGTGLATLLARLAIRRRS